MSLHFITKHTKYYELEDLLKRRSEVRARLDVLPCEIEKQKQALDAYSNALRRNAP